jgi:hypothetical protein
VSKFYVSRNASLPLKSPSVTFNLGTFLIVIGCLVPLSVVCLTLLTCAHLGKDAELTCRTDSVTSKDRLILKMMINITVILDFVHCLEFFQAQCFGN